MRFTRLLTHAILGLVAAASAACVPIPPSDPTPVVSTTATPSVAPTLTATPTTTRIATVAPASTPVVADSNNPWHVALTTTSAPQGWSVRPCEGDGPYLCARKGQEDVGAVQLSIYPIETMPDFQQMLSDAGVPAGRGDAVDPIMRDRVLAALQEFAEAYHASIEADRKVEYGDKVRYTRLENKMLSIGELPRLQYGFTGVNEDGTIFERWVSYAAYDGDLLYILVAAYRPGAIPTFRSDAELTEFLPHLDAIVADLRLPLPALETDVRSVRVLKPLDIFRSYSSEAGNPVGQVAAGQTVTVTGKSPTARHWRIECPDPVQFGCWIAGTSDATDPAAE